MASQYLLPCDCGARVVVETTQAGEQVSCECGALLEIPAFTRLSQLEPVDTGRGAGQGAAVGERSPWTRTQASLFTIGLLTAVLAGIGIGFGVYTRARIDTMDTIETVADDYLKFLDQQPPTELLEIWTAIRKKGLQDVRSLPIPEYVVNLRNYDKLTRLIDLACAAAAIGICMTVASLGFGEFVNSYINVLKKYAEFTGRASRSEYWMFILYNVIFSVVLTVIDLVVFGTPAFALLYGFAVLIPGIGVSLRRLHDTNRTGVLLLLGLVPCIGLILLVWFFQDSQPGENQYGANPNGVTAA